MTFVYLVFPHQFCGAFEKTRSSSGWEIKMELQIIYEN